MWTRAFGKGDGPKDRDDEKRKRSDSSATRRSKSGAESVVSSSSRKRSGRDSKSRVPDSPSASSYATFATARDDRDRDDMRPTTDMYDDPRDDDDDDDRRRRRREDDERSTMPRRDRSRSRERKSDKDGRVKRKKSRSEAGGSRPQEIVDAPYEETRSGPGQFESGGFSQYPDHPDHNGPPMMSGGLPGGTLSSHVQDQFPGQNPQQYATPFVPHAPVHTASFGEAADYYGDQGQSVQHQPGVRIEPPSVIVPQDQLHLSVASTTANPAADTGSGAAAEFYGTANIEPQETSKPPRPSSMPGAFNDDEPLPVKPPRPPKPNKPAKLSSAAGLAGAAGLGYTIGHQSSHMNTQHNTSYTNGHSGGSASMYYQGETPSAPAAETNYNGTSSYLPPYNDAVEDMPPPKPPRPGKQPSSSSHTGLYTAGAAGLAAYGLAHHNSNHHSHSHSLPGEQHGMYGSSPNAFMHKHEHKGPVHKFADWWKNLDDVRKMEEYTEYIGVCKDCFDPRSSPMDAPRKHHFNRRKRSGEFRPSGIKEKHSRYGLHEKASRSSLSDEERRHKRKSNNNSAAAWIAAGLGGVGLAKAGQALFSQQKNDFDDTYSIKSGRHSHSKVSHQSRSRSRSRDRHYYSSGRSEIRRRRSRSEDRLSHMSVGITNDRTDRKDYRIVKHHSHSRSRSHSRDRKSGILGAALGAGVAATAVSAASRRKHHNSSHSRSRSHSPQNAFVHHRRDSSERERRYAKNQRLKYKSSRSSVGSASIVDVSRPSKNQGGFLGGFFSAPPAKEKGPKLHSRPKKKKGFFNFGNASTSSSDSDIAFGQGFVQRKKRPVRRTSDEKLHANLAALGATAAAIAAAKAGRSNGRHRSEVVAVRENRHQTQSRYRRQSSASRYSSVDADGWEDLPDDETTDSGSVSSGLAFGDHELRKTKSRESINSNGSGTSKWGWRWGSKKQKKKPSNENLHNAGSSTSLVGPAATGAVAGALIGTGLHRHDSSASSNPSLQQVYPVQTPGDPSSFDARRTSSTMTPQPILTSQSGPLSIEQPQPIHQVPGAIYSTQAQPQPGYTAPSGPPVFSQPVNTSQFSSTGFDSFHHPAPPRRSNSSPVQSSSWKRDAAIAAVGAGLAGAAVASMKNKDRPSSSASNVRFDFTEEQARRERKRREEEEREEEDERRHRLDETDRREEERRKRELQRQEEEEARRRQETERLARQEAELREAERRREQEAKERREQEERIARRAREKAEEQERREHEARLAEQTRLELELEEEQKRRERAEQERRVAEQRQRDIDLEEEQKRRERREADRRAAEQREYEIQQDLDRRRREREAEEYSSRYEADRDRRQLEQQRTGNPAASDVRRNETEFEDRERDVVQSEVWRTPAGYATAAIATAGIAHATLSSAKENDKRRGKTSEPRLVKTIESRPVKTFEPQPVKTAEPVVVKTIAPSMVAQDYADDDIFNPNAFKKPIREPGSAQEVYQEWEDRYKPNNQPVSQAEFFAPKELLENTAPVIKVDPNEGAPSEFHIYQAHDDHEFSAPRQPPYPTSYSFTATKEGRGHTNPPYPVPELNLIQPTPPGSRANTPRIISLPPSPNIEPVQTQKEEPKQEEPTRRGSRVSWGPDHIKTFEVPTPDSYREEFISHRDLDNHSKQAQDEIVVEAGSSKSGKRTTTYRPDEPKLPEPEVPASTQYVSDQDNDDWVGTMSRKAGKKDKKKAKSAAAATAAAAVTAAGLLARDDSDNMSVMTDPFSDKYAASVISVAPSTSSAWSTPYSNTASEVTVLPYRSAGVEDEMAPELGSMHMPGSFDDSPPSRKVMSIENEWAPSTKDKKGKKVLNTRDEDALPSLEPTRDVVPESENVSSKKDKKKKKKKSRSIEDDSYSYGTGSTTVPSTFSDPEPVRVEESSPKSKPLTEHGRSTSGRPLSSERDINAKRDEELFFDQPQPSTTGSRTVLEQGSAKEPLIAPQPLKALEDDVVESTKSDKKDRKKKSKATKKAISSNPDDFERDPRDIEPSYTGDVTLEEPRASGSSSSLTTAAMAGGFAALVGTALKQDQDRIASDSQHARESMEHARSLPSTAFHDVNELNDVKTPKKKKKVSSGRWSPSIGSPLRSEVQYEDYIGSNAYPPASIAAREAPKAAPMDLGLSHVFPLTIRDGNDSGYYAPDDNVQPITADRESDEFFSAGSDEQKPTIEQLPPANTYEDRDIPNTVSVHEKHDDDYEREEQKPTIEQSPPASRYDDRDIPSTVSVHRKHDGDFEHDERHRRHYEDRPRSQSRNRGYEPEKDDSPSKRRHHRRRETDDLDDWDTRSAVSEARSEGTGERRRKHRHRDSERNGSPEEHRRSPANSEAGDIDRERKSSKRRSRRDDDDNASVVSSSSRYDQEKSSKTDKEKRPSGLFGLFSRSKENLAEPSSKSSKSKEDDVDGERRRRRKKHREGSMYGSDDDDARSTISSSSRREKRRSRTDSWDEKV